MSSSRARSVSHAWMAPPTHLKGVRVAAYHSIGDDGRVSPLDRLCPSAGPTPFFLPPLCRTAGKPPKFSPFRV